MAGLHEHSLLLVQAEVAGKIVVHEINTIEDFVNLRDSWNKVLKESKNDFPFLTWEHIFVSINNLKRNQKIRIVYLTYLDRIIAIAPFRQTVHTIARFMKYSVVEPLDYGSATDYNGLILVEQETACLKLIIDHFYKHKNWDFLCINDIPETLLLADLFIKHSKLFPKFKIEIGDMCPYIELPDSMENYLSCLTRNYRKDLARCSRKLSREHGEIELKEYHKIYSLSQGMDIFFELHQKRWLLLGQTGAFHSKDMRDIFLERAELFAEKGWLGLFFLTVDGKTVASKYCMQYNKKIYGCLSGIDPEYLSYSIGKILLAKVVEWGIQNGFEEYDFMKGSELYKFNVASGFRRNTNITFISGKFSTHLKAVFLSTMKRCKIFDLIEKSSHFLK